MFLGKRIVTHQVLTVYYRISGSLACPAGFAFRLLLLFDEAIVDHGACFDSGSATHHLTLQLPLQWMSSTHGSFQLRSPPNPNCIATLQ